jgi:glutathione peroxidase
MHQILWYAVVALGLGALAVSGPGEGEAASGAAGAAGSAPMAPMAPMAPPILRYKMASLSGQEVDLGRYRGEVLMIVNTASKCGFTPQYKGLEELYEKFHGRGFAVLGFPANNFLWQEPGSDAEIGAFCHKNYGVTFDMFSKISVRGGDKAPLYRYLTDERTNPEFSGEIMWNFTKFLVGRDGRVVARFGPRTSPEEPAVAAAVEAALARPRP